MEEYKYHLIENHDGDNELLKTFFDSLSALERKWVFSLSLEHGVLTVGWAGWIPASWRDRTEVPLPDGTVVQLEYQTLDGLQLAPSVVQSLRFLAHHKDNTIPYDGPLPNNINEAIDILDSCGLIVGEFEVQFEGLSSLGGPDSQLLFSRRLTGYTVAPEAHAFLQ